MLFWKDPPFQPKSVDLGGGAPGTTVPAHSGVQPCLGSSHCTSSTGQPTTSPTRPWRRTWAGPCSSTAPGSGAAPRPRRPAAPRSGRNARPSSTGSICGRMAASLSRIWQVGVWAGVDACVPENESGQRGRAGSPVLPHFLSFAFPGTWSRTSASPASCSSAVASPGARSRLQLQLRRNLVQRT